MSARNCASLKRRRRHAPRRDRASLGEHVAASAARRDRASFGEHVAASAARRDRASFDLRRNCASLAAVRHQRLLGIAFRCVGLPCIRIGKAEQALQWTNANAWGMRCSGTRLSLVVDAK